MWRTRSITVKFLQKLSAALVLQLVQAHTDVLQDQLHFLLSVCLQQPRPPAAPHVPELSIHWAQQKLVMRLELRLLLLRYQLLQP